ncbi:gagpol and env protein precursor, partial [Aphelenchoides avenae]
MRQDIRRWAKECFTCAHLNKKRISVPPLKPIIARQPYETVGIDVFSVAKTSSGNEHVVTVIDLHSKFCRAYAVADKSAPTIAKCLWEKWCLEECRKPASLLSDRGGEFVNDIVAEIAKVSGIDQQLTVGHNPRENGCTERMNQTLKALLMKMEDSSLEWDQRLPYALFYYNCCPHSTTGESPYFSLHGTDPTFVQFAKPSVTVSKYTVDDDSHKMNFARGMKALHELVSERIEREAAAMKAYYDQQHGVQKTSFQVSDRVFVYNPNIAVDRHSTKLTPQWEGPFRVLELSENSALVTYEIDGTLLDFSSVCPAHKSLKLSSVTSSMPSCAVLWTAKNVYDLAQGVQVAESLQLSPASRALFFANNSPLASTDSFAKPTEDTLVRVMAKLVSSCKERQSAFAAAAFKKLTCSPTARQPDLKLIVAERTRAELDDKKSLRSDPVIVLGGHNAQGLSDVLGAVFVEASTVPD